MDKYKIPRSVNKRLNMVTCNHHSRIPSKDNMQSDQIICSFNLVDEINEIGFKNNSKEATTTPIITFNIDVKMLKMNNDENSGFDDYEIVVNGLCNHPKVKCNSKNF